MNRIIIAKVSEISTGIIFVLIGLLLYGLGFVAVMYGDKSLSLALLMVIMAVFSVEMGVFWIKRFYLMKRGLNIESPQRLSAKLAKTAVPFIFLKNILFFVVFIIAYFVAVFFVVRYLLSGLDQASGMAVFLLLVLIPLYLILRFIFAKQIKVQVDSLLQKFTAELPKAEITGNNLVLHLGKGYLEKYRDLTIPLNDIDDIKVLNRYEGLALVKYILGPDIEFGTRTIKDKIAYQQGKIERPEFFSYLENTSGAKTLFIQGPKILYLVGAQDDDNLKKVGKTL